MTRSYSPSRDDEPQRVLGRVLAVAVDDQDELAGRAADAALHRGAVALVVGMPHHRGAGRCGALRPSPSRRAVVDDDDLAPRRRRRAARATTSPIDVGFVERGNDDGDG